MAKNTNKKRIFRFNRRIRGQTDYQLRLRLLKSRKTRAVFRRSNNNTVVQLVDYATEGDKIITSARSTDLKKFGYSLHTGNLVAAYLTGLLAGKRAKKSGFDGECVVDLGLQRSLYGNRLYAAVKGLVDSGINVRVSDVVYPDESRLDGSHLNGKNAASIVEKTRKSIEEMK